MAAATAAPVSANAAPGASAAAPARAVTLPATDFVHTLRPAWWPLIGKEWRTLRRDPQVWARLLYPLFIMGFWFYRSFSPGAVVTGRAVPLLSVGVFYGTLTFVTYFLPGHLPGAASRQP